jgi:hypothetical protein
MFTVEEEDSEGLDKRVSTKETGFLGRNALVEVFFLVKNAFDHSGAAVWISAFENTKIRNLR